jgi:hypothetical protein
MSGHPERTSVPRERIKREPGAAQLAFIPGLPPQL